MILDLDDEWRRDASCGNAPDDWVFFDHPAREKALAMQEARIICGSCPARAACLEYALNDLSLEGVWAATTHDQRRRMARNRKRESRAAKPGPAPIAECLRGHDTTSEEARDARNRCRECIREDKRATRAAAREAS